MPSDAFIQRATEACDTLPTSQPMITQRPLFYAYDERRMLRQSGWRYAAAPRRFIECLRASYATVFGAICLLLFILFDAGYATFADILICRAEFCLFDYLFVSRADAAG